MVLAAVILASVTTIIGTLWYVVLTVRKDIQPLLTSWIIFAITLGLGFWSYWHSPAHSLVGNLGAFVGMLSGVTNLGGVLFVYLTNKKSWPGFSKFQIWCLLIAGGIMCLWAILRFVIGNEIAATISNILTQVLMLIGYVALVQKLWRTDKDTESLFTWIMIWIASLFCLYPSFVKHDLLGLLYSGRAAVTAGLTVWLVLRIRVRNRQQNASALG